MLRLFRRGYAVTENGQLAVLIVPNEKRDSVCRVWTQQPIRGITNIGASALRDASITAIRGYVVLAARNVIAVYNTTALAGRMKADEAVREVAWMNVDRSIPTRQLFEHQELGGATLEGAGAGFRARLAFSVAALVRGATLQLDCYHLNALIII